MSPSSLSPLDKRRHLRQSMVAQRLALSDCEWERCNQALLHCLEHQFPKPPPSQCRVAFCYPMKNEPDLRPLMEKWYTAGSSLLLPVVVAKDKALRFRAWEPQAPLGLDLCGIPCPMEGPWLEPEVLFMPLNAFNLQGYRLGYGGGFFDRTLAELNQSWPASPPAWGPRRIGVGFDFQQSDDFIPEPHDQPLDLIVTETQQIVITQEKNRPRP